MKAENDGVVRVGMVHYINMAPIYEIWKERNGNEHPWRMVEAHPASLCRMLAENEIDLGFVSSHEYGARPENYRILSDLSISANGPVGSVFLFSKLDPEKLSGKKVLLSSESRTSVCLVRIILEKFYSVVPEYLNGSIRGNSRDQADAVLAIGDEALRLKKDRGFEFCLDLGEAWKTYTGLPFVFGICAVREEFCRENPGIVAAVHRELITCREKGAIDLQRVCTIAAPRIPMEVRDCYSYLKAIEHDLSDNKLQALERFFSYLVAYKEAAEGALPLKIHYPH